MPLLLVQSRRSTGRIVRKLFPDRDALERHIDRLLANPRNNARQFRFEVFARADSAGGATIRHNHQEPIGGTTS